MQTKVQKWGNGLGVRGSRPLADQMKRPGWRERDALFLGTVSEAVIQETIAKVRALLR